MTLSTSACLTAIDGDVECHRRAHRPVAQLASREMTISCFDGAYPALRHRAPPRVQRGAMRAVRSSSSLPMRRSVLVYLGEALGCPRAGHDRFRIGHHECFFLIARGSAPPVLLVAPRGVLEPRAAFPRFNQSPVSRLSVYYPGALLAFAFTPLLNKI